MSNVPEQSAGERAQDAIAAVLRYGSMLSTVVMALAVLLAMLRGGTAGLAAAPAPGALLRRAFELDPFALAELGILLLLLTPVLRVLIAVVAFAMEGDCRYVLISSGVLLVVLASIGFAMIH